MRRDILTNLKTTLEGITVAAGYATGIKKVERVHRPPEDPPAEQQRPWIGYMVGPTERETQPFGEIRCTMNVWLLAYLSPKSDDEHEDLVAQLEDDLVVALMKDQSRGGKATSTTLGPGESNEGFPQVGTRVGEYVEQLRIVYFRSATVST